MKEYRWVYKSIEADPALFNEVKKATGSDIIAKLLVNRGITGIKQVEDFLNPDNVELTSPFVFPDMQKAVERINGAIQNRESIVIYGDFDSDGVTSTALMYKTLKHLGADASYYIPGRSDEGHGLNRAALCRLISAKKTKLIITVDCGISNISEIKLAQSLGTDVIITDHHEPLEEIPEAYAVINPKMLHIERVRQLAGVGVAFKLAEALLKSYNKQDFTDKILPLVAIGTVGDVVPLINENRLLVYKGLRFINNSKPFSIAKLMEISGHKPDKEITSTVLAFTVVPRINAIGRLSEANSAVEFLISEDRNRIELLAAELDRNNRERQQLCDNTYNRAEEKISAGEIDLNSDKAVILGDSGWHPGIIGLVASRLVEKYHRPAILFSLDEEKEEARCSARSIEGLNLFETLSNFSEYFVQFGGHSLAAGFCANLKKIEFEKLKNIIMSQINRTIAPEILKPELKIDLDINAGDLTEDFIEELDKLAPYGELNPYPVFSISNITLKSINTMGARKNHLKIILGDKVNNSLEAVWWQKNSLDICPENKVNAAFVPSINNYMNQKRIQLILKDLQPVSTGETPDTCFFSGDNAGDKWIDHRNESGFKREFLEYLREKALSVAIFAESPRALEIIEKIPFLKPAVVDRMSAKEADCLVLLDFPPDDIAFVNIINTTNPSEIHLFGILNTYDPVELVRKISGMFRYAHNEKKGVVDINRAAASLALSADVMFSCARMLDEAGVIGISQVREKSLEFAFLKSVELGALQELPSYREFISELGELVEFKNDCKTREIDLIRETLDNLDAFQCIP